MTFFVDENFPKSVSLFLRSNKHTVHDIRSTELEGSSDIEIFEMAQKEGAIFLTSDMDFYSTIPIKYPVHKGIAIVALKFPNQAAITERFIWAYEHNKLQELENKVLLLKDKSYIIKETA